MAHRREQVDAIEFRASTTIGASVLMPPAMGHGMRLVLLAVPALAGWMAWRTGVLALKVAVPSLCALLLVVSRGPLCRSRDVAWVVAAFAFSLIGDTFLSTRAGRESFYLAGIAAFFLAHVGYLGFALRNGRLHRVALGLLLAGYGGWFVVQLGPAIGSRPLQVAAFLYLLISCTTLSAAFGLRLPAPEKPAYLVGIGLIVFSDTLIALSDFLKDKSLSFLILPTYYLAQIAVTAALLLRNRRIGVNSPHQPVPARPGSG